MKQVPEKKLPPKKRRYVKCQGKVTKGDLAINGDNLRALAEMPTESVSLAILCPPQFSDVKYHLTAEGEEDRFMQKKMVARLMQGSRDPSLFGYYARAVGQILHWPALLDLIRATESTCPKKGKFLLDLAARLVEVKRVLKADGSVFVVVGAEMLGSVEQMMQILFGSKGRVATCVRQRADAHNDATTKPAEVLEYILHYANADFRYMPVRVVEEDRSDKVRKRLGYTNWCEEAQDWFSHGDIKANGSKSGYTYNYNACGHRKWLCPKESMIERVASGEYGFVKDGKVVPKQRGLTPGKMLPWSGYVGKLTTTLWNDLPKNNAFMRALGATMPVEMAVRMILSTTAEGDLVFAVYGGTGTVLEAARSLNRQCISCEIVPEIHTRAVNRVGGEGLLQVVLPEVRDAFYLDNRMEPHMLMQFHPDIEVMSHNPDYVRGLLSAVSYKEDKKCGKRFDSAWLLRCPEDEEQVQEAFGHAVAQLQSGSVDMVTLLLGTSVVLDDWKERAKAFKTLEIEHRDAERQWLPCLQILSFSEVRSGNLPLLPSQGTLSNRGKSFPVLEKGKGRTQAKSHMVRKRKAAPTPLELVFQD